MPDSIEPIAADLALGEVTVPDGNGAPLGRDVALLFLTRAIRMFGYGLLSVVLVLYRSP